MIKNERNKCVNLIQTSTQKAAEMKEKIKILQNEIEILRTAVMQKDRWGLDLYTQSWSYLLYLLHLTWRFTFDK